MSLKEEILLDFDLRSARITVNGSQAVIDNVKQLIVLSDDLIVVNCGKRSISVRGNGLSITFLDHQRMFLNGTIEAVEFYGEMTKHE
ncbi:MAG: YabP/YqfC family sporulation protein [Firmicutes bacterium]|nr:YabP/YqfC family sporulation protein [Bacillota bacterium]